MLTPSTLPSNFSVKHKAPKFSHFIELHLTAGAAPKQWNGYYRSWRVMLRCTEIEWIVEAVLNGIHMAIFRWPRKDPSFDDLSILVQCCCYYVDSVHKEI